MTRHTFATKAPGKPVMVCQCPQCKGRTPEPLCPHTAELWPVAVTHATIKPTDPQRSFFEEG